MSVAPAEHARLVAIAVAPNGGRKSKADHARLPVTPQECALTAAASLEAGACMIHAHARDGNGRHTLDVEANLSLIAAIKQAVGDRLVIQMTTEAVGVFAPEEQIAAVRAVRPEACSIAPRELVPTPAHEKDFAGFLHWAQKEEVACQYILYTPEDVAKLADLRRRGLVPGEGLSVIYVLGRYAVDQRSHPSDLLPLLAIEVPDRADWMLCAFGPDEAACAAASFALDSGARVGFENNMSMVDGSTAPDNAALVRQAVSVARAIGRVPMDADTYRARLAQILSR